MLIDRTWKLKYTPEDGDLVQVFYVPALQDAARYDRLTGYFDAGAFALAARAVEGLVRNDGRMRLVVGCTLKAPEIEAINKGEALRDQVERRLVEQPLAPPDAAAVGALELLAWYLSDHFLNQVRYWGIRPSFGLLKEPETNGVVERWNRTLKEQAVYGRVFQNLADVRAAVAEFVERYNRCWRLEKLAYRTPLEAREEYELRQAA